MARWLRDKRGYEYVDTDSATMYGLTTDLQSAWMELLNRRITSAAFVQKAAGRRHPVVIEYGLWARPPQIELLRQLCAAGAQAWWFDGDRTAAKESWRQENVRASRPFPDVAWDNVVGEIERNWSSLTEFFGSRIVRTVEVGPSHPSPADTFNTMETTKAAGAGGVA